MANTYVVIWFDHGGDHLKAVSNDGIHGIANCSFPKRLYGLDRTDFRNVYSAFEVSNLQWAGTFYRVPEKVVLGVLPKLKSAYSYSSEQNQKPQGDNAWTTTSYKEWFEVENGNENTTQKETTAVEEPVTELNANELEIKKPEKVVKKVKATADWFGESMRKISFKPFNLTEALFENKFKLREADEDGNDIETGSPITLRTEKSSDVIEPDLNLMIGSPIKKSTGKPKDEAWLLIKIYEACIVPGTTASTPIQTYVDPVTKETLTYPGIKRAELLKRIGTALHDTKGQSSTFFNLFTELGLAHVNPTGDYPDTVFPGSYLKDWVEGVDLQLQVPNNGKSYELQYHYKKDADGKYTIPFERPYGGGEDLRKWVNYGNLPKKTPASSSTLRADGTGYGVDPFADYPGITVVANPNKSKKAQEEEPYATTPISHTPTPAVSKQAAAELAAKAAPNKERKVKKMKVASDWFGENLEEEVEMDTTYRDGLEERRQAREAKFIEDVKKAYRTHCDLEEDADISDKFDDFQFRGVCCNHNWPYESTKEKIWGKGI